MEGSLNVMKSHSWVLVGFINHLDFYSLLSSYVPNTALNALQVLSYLIFTTTQWERCYCYPHLIDGETKAQRGHTACLRSHS